jgi:hypothetical protein
VLGELLDSWSAIERESQNQIERRLTSVSNLFSKVYVRRPRRDPVRYPPQPDALFSFLFPLFASHFFCFLFTCREKLTQGKRRCR